MSLSHDELAEFLSRTILHKYRDIFGNVFISNVSMDFPKPDFIYIPYRLERMRVRELESYLRQAVSTDKPLPLPVSFEVKTPYVYKHEYITGIGQAISYNSIFPLSYLVIPNYNMEGFNVLEFIRDVVEINSLNIGLISYEMENPEEVELVKEASIVRTQASLVREVKSIRRSYSYWRETKPHEVFEALRISKELEKEVQDSNILDLVLSRLWEEVLSERFPKAKRPSSFKLNYKLFLIQNALLDVTGRLTIIGRHTLTLGEHFGKDSETFKEIITYIMLKYGGHYILLSKIYEEQRKMNEKHLATWDTWAEEIIRRLKEQNYYISKDDFRVDRPRLLYAYQRYFCGIAENEFIKGKGITINFPKIISILDKGSKLFSIIEQILSL